MADKEKTDKTIKRHTFLVRFGGGLGKRLAELLGFEEFYKIIFSSRSITKAVKSIKEELKKQRKVFDKQLMKDLTGLIKLEKDWIKAYGIGGAKKTARALIESGLNYELADTFGSDGNKATPQKMINGAFGRRETQLTDITRSIGYSLMSATEGIAALKAIERQFTRNIETSSLTAVLSITNQMREQVYLANDHVVRGVIMSAVLDGRTTQFCKSIDGKIFKSGQGPRPPFHPRCRTMALPVFKSETDSEARGTLEFRPQVKAGENYQKKGVKGKKNLKRNRETGQIETLPSGKPRKSGKTYAYFLSSQMNDKGGREFIRDSLGKAKGNKFIKLVNEGLSPNSALKRVLPDQKTKILSLEGLKKRK